MKATGMTRPIDDLGRIVLPIELRRTMDLNEGDRMEIFTEGDTIIIRKYQAGCIFCGTVKNTMIYKGKNVCADCMDVGNVRTV